MQFTSFLENGQLTVALTGEIDHHSAKKYIEVIEGKIEAYIPDVCTLDFRDVAFMDSSGIGVILGRYRQLRDRGGQVGVIHMNPHIQRIFQMSGMDRVIHQLDRQEAAQ